jgi:gamma-glutamylcyclotransferase (GGCT)/AIG2-like uncharacterized protein YtfP
MNRTRVFVYGTLKRGQINHALLTATGTSEFKGLGSWRGRQYLADLGYYPAMVEDQLREFMSVFGEVWEIDVDTLYALDQLEGHPQYYKRRKVRILNKNTWVYFLPRGIAEPYLGLEDGDIKEIESGIWCPSAEETEYSDNCRAAMAKVGAP